MDETCLKLGILNFIHDFPCECPVRDCHVMLTPMELLAHMLMHHGTYECVHEVRAGEVSIYVLDLDKLLPGRNYCLALLALAEASQVPEASKALEQNQNVQIFNHIPFLFMIYVTNWADLIESKFVEEHIIPQRNSKHMLVYLFYVVSCISTRKASAQIVAMDLRFQRIRHGTRVVRNYAYSPVVASQLAPCGNDYMYFTAEDIGYLCNSTTMNRQITIRIVLHGHLNLLGYPRKSE